MKINGAAQFFLYFCRLHAKQFTIGDKKIAIINRNKQTIINSKYYMLYISISSTSSC